MHTPNTPILTSGVADATDRRSRTPRRHVLAVTVALVVGLAAPAVAASDDLVANPDPEPPATTVTIAVEDVCGANAAGFVYSIEVQDPPPGETSTVVQYRDAASGQPLGNQAGPNGFVASGEGDFEARGVLLLQGDPGGLADPDQPTSHASDWVPVTVDCPDDPEDPGDPDDPGTTGTGTEIVRGTPTFTG